MSFIKIFKVQYYKLDKDNTQSNLCVFEISPGGPPCLWVSYLQIQHTVDQKEKKKKRRRENQHKTPALYLYCTCDLYFLVIILYGIQYSNYLHSIHIALGYKIVIK